MMGSLGIKMNITVKKDELLAKLLANRKQHAAIVVEARKGYIEKAGVALMKRMEQLANGKIVALRFSLSVPTDHTDVYDTVIGMLNMAVEDELTLSPTEYRQLVEDEWDWTSSFLSNTAAYSGLANKVAIDKGVDL